LVYFSPFWYSVPRKIWQPCLLQIWNLFCTTPSDTNRIASICVGVCRTTSKGDVCTYSTKIICRINTP
jgi:hypothetical protein